MPSLSVSLVAFHLLQFPPGGRFGALQGFVGLRRSLPAAPGVRFAKVMGCGRGAVFSVRPDWGRYAFLVEWENAGSAKAFYGSKHWQPLEARAGGGWHLLLQSFHSKGLWDGAPRFLPDADGPPSSLQKMAVITRADLKPWKLRSFAAHARRATAALEGHPGLLFSLGMGEWPLVRQATFSLWDGAEAMKSYAYKNAVHQEAMRGKNKERWYGEELYARFAVLRESGESAEALFPSV